MVEKAEFVCECDYSDQLHMWYSCVTAPRERIVRCRDCKYSTSMGYQCKWFHGYYLTHAQVVPDGFCAWGDPREVGE